jgi:hypothetical protein
MCKLEPLTLEELREYLHHRLTQAGLPQQNLFPEDAILAIFEYTRGIPRLINSLCDIALHTGFGLRSPLITTAIIREAARDLDLLSNNSHMAWPVNGSSPVVASSDAGNLRPSSAAVLPTLEGYVTRQKSLSFLASAMGLRK